MAKSTELLVVEIQQADGFTKERLFKELIGRMDGAIYKLSASMGATQGDIDADDRRAMLLELLWKCCRDFDGRAKFTTMFWVYAHKQKIELWKSYQTDKRKVGWEGCFSLDEADRMGREEPQFSCIEMMDCIEKFPISEKEKTYLKLTIQKGNLTESEKAALIGVGCSAITHMKKNIMRKVTLAEIFQKKSI